MTAASDLAAGHSPSLRYPRSGDVCAAHGVHAMHSTKSLGTASKTLRDLPQVLPRDPAKAQPKSPFRYLARPRRGNGIQAVCGGTSVRVLLVLHHGWA
jgi:hypothetical protein